MTTTTNGYCSNWPRAIQTCQFCFFPLEHLGTRACRRWAQKNAASGVGGFTEPQSCSECPEGALSMIQFSFIRGNMSYTNLGEVRRGLGGWAEMGLSAWRGIPGARLPDYLENCGVGGLCAGTCRHRTGRERSLLLPVLTVICGVRHLYLTSSRPVSSVAQLKTGRVHIFLSVSVCVHMCVYVSIWRPKLDIGRVLFFS